MVAGMVADIEVDMVADMVADDFDQISQFQQFQNFSKSSKQFYFTLKIISLFISHSKPHPDATTLQTLNMNIYSCLFEQMSTI